MAPKTRRIQAEPNWAQEVKCKIDDKEYHQFNLRISNWLFTHHNIA